MTQSYPYRTALVTGASSGIGRALTKWLAARDVKVYAAARREDELEKLASEARHVTPVVLDVTQTDAVFETLLRVDEDAGGIDLVVANAGLGAMTNGRKLEWDRVQRLIDVNVRGAAATLSALLPRMVERDFGHLVGVSSLSSHRALPKYGVYSATKAFLSTFCEGLRIDLQETGVSVTCVEPGFVKTAMTDKNRFKMPFMLTAEAAAEKMGEAIRRKERLFAFPLPTTVAMHALAMAPGAVLDLAGRKF